MENEYQVLAHLQKNEKTSQRAIAERTGLSLGAVNILIKKMVRKGLVKVEKLNSRSMRYILTPQGMKEKTSLTYSFVRSSYRQIINIYATVEELIGEQYMPHNNDQVFLYGPNDEVNLILKDSLKTLNIKPQIINADTERLKPDPQQQQLILTWRPEDEEALAGQKRVYNIMNLI